MRQCARSVPVRLLLAAAVLGLGGCASMTPEECKTADWYEKGMSDGQHGRARAYLEDHVKACSEVGVRPNRERYMAGRDIGIRQYCTPHNGLQEGRRGASYANSCPPELEPAFLARYRAGYEVYRAQQRLDQINQRVQSKQRELDKAKEDKDRSRLRRDLRDLDGDARRARADLYAAERRLDW